MVAVNPTRLKFQINGLMAFFDSPVEFHQKLNNIFSLYANYALKLGDNALMRPLIPMYHLPHPVIRQLSVDMQLHIDQDPQAALSLADELWEDEYYEVKRVAVFILGQLPRLENPQPLLSRIRSWLTPDLDNILKTDIITLGMGSLQRHFTEDWEELIISLLSLHNAPMAALGIQALAEGAKNHNFKNLPVIFRLINPFILNPDPVFIHDLEGLIEVLAELSPQETGYYLNQILSLSANSDSIRLVKNCLPFFPPENQTQLKEALKR